jgi:hypothetical protein
MKTALIHRYDDPRDIQAVREFLGSEAYRSSLKFKNKFDLVIVVPTIATRSKMAVYGSAISGQYRPRVSKSWPGRVGPYNFRIDMEDVRLTTVARVKRGAKSLPGGKLAR